VTIESAGRLAQPADDASVIPTTLIELLTARAAQGADVVRFQFLDDTGEPESTLTYGQLDAAARRIAARLSRTLSPGDRALLLYAPGLDFLAGFYGCLYAGVIAVPVAPPQPSKLEADLARLASIMVSADTHVLLTSTTVADLLAPALRLHERLAELQVTATDGIDEDHDHEFTPPTITEDSIAYLQYSSGSTGEPKGVVLTHRNVLANNSLVSAAVGVTEDSVVVTWLPTYHDMGLLALATQPLYNNILAVGLAPFTFVKRPARWIEALARFQATFTVAPNFAFELATRRVPADLAATCDLSRLRAVLCGAEPIRVETLAAFVEHFQVAGLDPDSLFPCYGLAEATLFVSGGPVERGYTTIDVDPDALAGDSVKLSPGGRTLVGCGTPSDGFDLVLVDPATGTPVQAGRVGEICLRGASIGSGYWSAEDLSAQTFGTVVPGHGAGFLRTGDLGFVHADQLYIVGRKKDLIVVDGYNHYPTDLEASAMRSHAAIRPDRCVAFQTMDTGKPQLIIVAELDRDWLSGFAEDTEGPVDKKSPPPHLDQVARAIRGRIGRDHGLRLDDIVLVAAGSVLLTSSGKVRRKAMQQRYREDSLDRIG